MKRGTPGAPMPATGGSYIRQKDGSLLLVKSEGKVRLSVTVSAEVAERMAKAGHPLDHDGDGNPGGRKPFAERGLDELKAEAIQLGIKVDKRASAGSLQRKIDDAREARDASRNIKDS